MTETHISVLLKESIEALAIKPSGIYVDGTFGRGGHSKAMLNRLGDKGRLIAFDKDPQAIACANEIDDERFTICHSSFADMKAKLTELGVFGQVDGLLLDLGVSSPQLDDADRGFSFMRDGPLDMRMNNQDGQNAADWINAVDADEMIRVLKTYGEEKFAKRIATKVIARRQTLPFERTADLAQVIDEAVPVKEPGKHPATKSFQAIRIWINKELEDIERGLEAALDALKPAGRLVVISFHSLEDRLVKRFIRDQARGTKFPKGVPVMDSQLGKRLKKIGGSVKPSAQELDVNRRARSSILRAAEKIA